MKSLFAALFISSVYSMHIMQMIDGVEVAINDYLQIENFNEATLQYVDERVDIH